MMSTAPLRPDVRGSRLRTKWQSAIDLAVGAGFGAILFAAPGWTEDPGPSVVAYAVIVLTSALAGYSYVLVTADDVLVFRNGIVRRAVPLTEVVGFGKGRLLGAARGLGSVELRDGRRLRLWGIQSGNRRGRDHADAILAYLESARALAEPRPPGSPTPPT